MQLTLLWYLLITGPEVVGEAVRVLELVSSKSKDFTLNLKEVSDPLAMLPVHFPPG